jgi:hypothetical protein
LNFTSVLVSVLNLVSNLVKGFLMNLVSVTVLLN